MNRKTFSALLFLLLLTSPLHAQGIKQKIKTFRNSKRFIVKYDKHQQNHRLTLLIFAVEQNQSPPHRLSSAHFTTEMASRGLGSGTQHSPDFLPVADSSSGDQ